MTDRARELFEAYFGPKLTEFWEKSLWWKPGGADGTRRLTPAEEALLGKPEPLVCWKAVRGDCQGPTRLYPWDDIFVPSCVEHSPEDDSV